MLMYDDAGISRQSELRRLREAVEAELARGPFCVGLQHPLRERHGAAIAAARSRQLTFICRSGSVLYMLAALAFGLLGSQARDWSGIVVYCLLPSVLAVGIAQFAVRPKNSVLMREGGAFAAASCFSLATLLAVCAGPSPVAVLNLFLVSLAVVAALFFVPLRFATAAAFVGLTALALWVALMARVDAPQLERFYPLAFLLAVSTPALLSVHRLERAARDLYLRALLHDVRIEQLAFENSRLSQLSATDALTGAANRRHLEQALRHLCGQPPCGDFLLLADIDFFKRFNDNHGHMAGDTCLREVVTAIRSQLRRSDLVARFGGEEFAIVLPRTTYADALVTAERIRAGVACQRVSVNGTIETVTVSIGIAERRPGMPPATLMALADNALYAAKREGRNRVQCAAPAPREVAA